MKVQHTSPAHVSFDQTHASTQTDSLNKHAAFANLLDELEKPPEFTPTTAIGHLTKDMPISEQAKELYNTAKRVAGERVDESLEGRERAIEVYRETMMEVMDMPIEVEVLPSEINEALLFNNLGINYLEFKELKVRMEMLTLAEKDIDQDEGLYPNDKEKLRSIATDLKAQLQAQIDDLLAGKDKLDEEALKADFKNHINTQFEELGLNDVNKFDLLKQMM